ncbi:GNAT family N-acetyltransferase [Streptomyces sp. cmx-18-6]|uniref:GNAT family N-acetyltransferase n=1 Tax=Streptomyces sp. cmx-18-6 TaxID=2790930 RepID=UPI00397EB778
MNASVTLEAAATPTAPPLLLRPWCEQDVTALVDAYRDPDLRRWAQAPMESEDDGLRWVRDQERGWATGDRFGFAVLEAAFLEATSLEATVLEGPVLEGAALEGAVLGATALGAGTDTALHRLVGNVVLKDVASGKPSAEVGYWTTAQARGRGVAPRALATLTAWSFNAFRAGGLEYLELLHQADNLASCRVAEKNGYLMDRVLPAAPPLYPLDGHLHIRRAVA